MSINVMSVSNNTDFGNGAGAGDKIRNLDLSISTSVLENNYT